MPASSAGRRHAHPQGPALQELLAGLPPGRAHNWLEQLLRDGSGASAGGKKSSGPALVRDFEAALADSSASTKRQRAPIETAVLVNQMPPRESRHDTGADDNGIELLEDRNSTPTTN